MEPSYPLSILEVTVLFVALGIWFASRREAKGLMTVGTGADIAPVAAPEPVRATGRHSDERLRNVPIPWGWPNCTYYRGRRNQRTMSETMHEFMVVLFTEKQLVAEAAPDPKVVNSMRALLEDRFHRVDRSVDPAQPQSGQPDEDIWFVGPVAETRDAANQKYKGDLQSARELKTPWGW